ncbi:MAG: restriction system-associated AAA family ATPase [Bacteroidota bacterium]|nr:restriction system-associated AAA family ATPase [Bacteroidota bacterium]
MKIHRLYIEKIEHRPLLNGVEMLFYSDPKTNSKELNPNCFIGVNGSGKSQILETLAEIFFYLDKLYGGPNLSIVIHSPFLFEIDYSVTLDNNEYFIEIKQYQTKGKPPEINITCNNTEVEWFVETMYKFLPKRVIGYTSGANETLSFPFMDYYDEYAGYTAKRALGKESKSEDYEPRFYFMDYTTNIGVVISNLLYPETANLNSVLKVIGLKGLRSFQLIIQTKHKAAPSNGVKLTKELEEWISYLSNVATCYEYIKAENKYILDFYNNETTRNALKIYFKTPIELYTALYKIELLNNLIIDDNYLKEIKRKRRTRKSLIRNPTVADKDKVLNYSEIKLRLLSGAQINYLELSDGEHQYMNVFGTILMTNYQNTLYLLDEPETHFNPNWRREFIKILNDITHNRKQDIFITSHSPFIVADCKREKVYIFKKKNSKLTIEQPSNETYGSNFDYILKMAFEMGDTLSEKSLKELHALQKSDSISKIESNIGNFGESVEKFYLLKRLEELKTKD